MLKKIVFFIPAVLFSALLAFVRLGMGYSMPVAYFWIGLLVLSGVLLAKDLFWGAVPGMLPGAHLIMMSTQYTGQVINIERPLGFAVIIFFLLCGIRVFKKETAGRD